MDNEKIIVLRRKKEDNSFIAFQTTAMKVETIREKIVELNSKNKDTYLELCSDKLVVQVALQKAKELSEESIFSIVEDISNEIDATDRSISGIESSLSGLQSSISELKKFIKNTKFKKDEVNK